MAANQEPGWVLKQLSTVVVTLGIAFIAFMFGRYYERQNCPYHKARGVIEDLQKTLK